MGNVVTVFIFLLSSVLVVSLLMCYYFVFIWLLCSCTFHYTHIYSICNYNS